MTAKRVASATDAAEDLGDASFRAIFDASQDPSPEEGEGGHPRYPGCD